MRDPKLITAKLNEFRRGELPNGNAIGFYKSPEYSLFKRNLNPLAGGTVDLILTGSFTRGLFVDDIAPSRFLFDSHDEKTDLLIGKYGLDIMGINQQEWERLQRNVYAPQLVKFIKRQIGQ